MTIQVTWAEIQAEANDYKAGFVALFRKYEGQTTDEKTAQGHPVKVTQRSFARQFGISESTFRLWIKESERASSAQAGVKDERQARWRAESVVRHEPDELAQAIMNAPERTRDKILDEANMARAGQDRSPAGRKAAHARGKELQEPVERAVNTFTETLGHGEVWATIELAVDQLEEQREEGKITVAKLMKIQTYLDRLICKVADVQEEIKERGSAS